METRKPNPSPATDETKAPVERHRLSGVHPWKSVDDGLLQYTVTAARHRGQWVVVRLKGLNTWCFPGGSREPGESIETCGERELLEETGATSYTIEPLALYGVDHFLLYENGREEPLRRSWGAIFSAHIEEFGPLPEKFEIAEIAFVDRFPLEKARFPGIQPGLMDWLEGRRN